jgi:hypothetical protein
MDNTDITTEKEGFEYALSLGLIKDVKSFEELCWNIINNKSIKSIKTIKSIENYYIAREYLFTKKIIDITSNELYFSLPKDGFWCYWKCPVSNIEHFLSLRDLLNFDTIFKNYMY